MNVIDQFLACLMTSFILMMIYGVLTLSEYTECSLGYCFHKFYELFPWVAHAQIICFALWLVVKVCNHWIL